MAKREVPSRLKLILTQDSNLTESFVKYTDRRFGPLSNFDKWMKGFEISCHGIPWLFITATVLFLFDSVYLRQFAVNIFIALILDILVVAIIKSLARRRRPSANKNDMFATFAVDKFSFPSGHATRVIMLSIVFVSQYSLIFPLSILLMSWSIMVCVSRVLLRRHHILDIVGGVFIGAIEAFLVCRFTWLHEDSTQAVIQYFLDETGVGASFDV